MSTAALVLLARAPRTGVAAVLTRPSPVVALMLLSLATLTSTLVAARVGSETDVNELYFAGTRSGVVQAMIDALGAQRTAVVLYLVQRSFDAIVVATALSPLFYWLLGSTAVQASARLAGVERPFRPLLYLFAYATALTVVPANAVTLVLGVGKGFGPQLASLAGIVCVGWLLAIVYWAIRAHYGVDRDRAIRILVVAVVVFYFVPLVLIVGSAVAIIVAAVVLQYF